MVTSKAKCVGLAIVLGSMVGAAVALLTQHIGAYLIAAIAIITLLLGCSPRPGKLRNYPRPPLIRS
ncbi:MAG TPA: hypothetical protein VMT53_04330 [Terriglobales bacterium]|nr:hypothetical protein [Terriglobales bacterium]